MKKAIEGYIKGRMEYKTLLSKLWELRKWIYALNLFVITIVFTILSFRERASLYFQCVIYS